MRLLTIEQSAHLMGVHHNTIRRWIRLGQLVNRANHGRKILIAACDLVDTKPKMKCPRCGGDHWITVCPHKEAAKAA